MPPSADRSVLIEPRESTRRRIEGSALESLERRPHKQVTDRHVKCKIKQSLADVSREPDQSIYGALRTKSNTARPLRNRPLFAVTARHGPSFFPSFNFATNHSAKEKALKKKLSDHLLSETNRHLSIRQVRISPQGILCQICNTAESAHK